MPTRTAYPGTESAGDTLTATNFDKLPGGWIGYAEVTADQTGLTSSTVDLSGLSVTVTVNTSRRIRVVGKARFTTDTANDDAQLNIEESGILSVDVVTMARITTPFYGALVEAILTPSAGSHTYKLTGGKAAGGGTVTMKAAATYPAYILVEDIGGTS